MGPASKPEQCRHQEISQQGHADVEGEAFGVRLLSPCQQPSLRSANLQLLCWIGLFWERVWNREEEAYFASLTITLLALWPSTHQPVPASTLFAPGTATHLQSVALRGRLQSHSTPQPRSASIPQNIRQAHCTAIQSQSHSSATILANPVTHVWHTGTTSPQEESYKSFPSLGASLRNWRQPAHSMHGHSIRSFRRVARCWL